MSGKKLKKGDQVDLLLLLELPSKVSQDTAYSNDTPVDN